MFVALFVWLKIGISTESLVFGKYKVDGLYIKLDKKLTLKADNVSIPKNKAKPSFHNIDKTFDKIKYLFTFFDYIDLKNVTFDNNHINILFTDEILYITSDDYEIAGNIHRREQKFVAEVSMFHIKKENIHIKGTLTYDLDTDILATEGNFSAYHIRGEFFAVKEQNKIDFKIQSDNFTDLKTLIRTFGLQASLESWIVDRVKAKEYKLHSLTGDGQITDNGFKVNFDTLKGEMLFKDVKIFYQKELDPILAKSFILRYADKSLHFDLKNPAYKGRSMQGSTIDIVGLGKPKTMLKLDLHMKTPIDKELQKILKSYDVHIPVKHTGEPVIVDLKMDIPLKKSSKKQKSTVMVNVNLKKGKLWYKNIKLPLLKANVKFDNRKKESLSVDAVLKNGMVNIAQTKLPVKSGTLHYEKGTVTLNNVQLKESWYDGKVKGRINLKKKKADLKLHAKQISIGDKEKFLVLKNKQLPLTLDYSKNLRIYIPTLDLKITHRKKDMHIEVGNIKKIKPYLRNIGIQIDGGKLDIIKNGTNYTFRGVLRRNACFLYEKNGACRTKIPCSGKVSKAGIDFYAFGKRLHYSSKKSRIRLKDLNIDLKKFLDVRKKNNRNKRDNKKGKKSKIKKLVILGKNSKVRYGKHALVTDSYDIEIQPNGNIKAFGSLSGDIVQFSKKGKIFSIKALRVKDKMLHPLIGFKGLKKGRYSLKKSGNPDKVMKGQIIIEGGIMSDFKAYNNTLAFINAVPALATLSNPGFSEKGFRIKEGVAEYRMIKEKIVLDSVYIKGTSASIVGKGVIDMKTRTIKMDLAIQTARELGKFVGNLPLLGYILMGKDKSMTVGLKITGSLEKPIVKTSAAKEILSLPLQLLKRTLESPLHIINK